MRFAELDRLVIATATHAMALVVVRDRMVALIHLSTNVLYTNTHTHTHQTNTKHRAPFQVDNALQRLMSNIILCREWVRLSQR